jgi:putative Mg2+ transporter-C (MgtC) family protein
MAELWQEYGTELTDVAALLRVVLKMALAMALGSVIGLNREHAGENAGWRTHILVTMAAAAFVMAMRESGAAVADLVHVVQGVAAGVGFLGAGVILRLTDSVRVKGLTTAASIWLSAAVGSAIGVGRIWLPVVAAIFGWFTLAYVRRWENHVLGSPAEHDA